MTVKCRGGQTSGGRRERRKVRRMRACGVFPAPTRCYSPSWLRRLRHGQNVDAHGDDTSNWRVGCWRALMETTQRRRARRYIYTYKTGSLMLHARPRCPRATAPPSASGTHRAASYQSSTSPCKKQRFSHKPALQLLTALTRSNVPVPRRGAR